MSVTTSSDRTAVLDRVFETARREGRAALIPYFTAGHPTPGETPAILRMLAEEGVDVIEMGVPFSDPLADGPTIQKSSFRAIEQGMDLAGTLALLADFRREHDTAVVLFTYLNPVLHYGLERFLADAHAAGAQGVLLTDLPVGADAVTERAFAESPLALIRLIAPTTRPERAREIAEAGRGFVYYISRTGVTGASVELAAGLADEVGALRAVSPVPVAVGFGISTPEQATAVAAVADGVVVGSALVDALGRGGAEGARPFVRALRQAVERPG